jgi:hypothetical protein
VGNGRNTPFWEAKWIQRAAPKDLAPGLFKSAIFKKRSVYSKLKNSNWIRNLGVIDSPELLDEYVTLFLAISSFSLTEHLTKSFGDGHQMANLLSPQLMIANSGVQYLYSHYLMFGKHTPNLRSSSLPGWLSTIEPLWLTTWLKNSLAIHYAPYVIVSQKQHHTSLRAGTTPKLSGTPLLPITTSRVMLIWAPIRIWCNGLESLTRQVAEKKGALSLAFSSPFGGNYGKKGIGECFRPKRNPSCKLPLSFRKRWLFF